MKRLLIVGLLLFACSVWAIPPSPPSSSTGDMTKAVYDTNSNNVVDTAATATALASNPTDCGANALATAIDASGNLTCGKTIGTDVQTELSILKGTYTDTYLCKYTSSGTLLDCNVDPAGFQTADADLTTYAGITPSADMQALLGSADYATARTNMGTWGVSGAITDEQLVCSETTGGTNLLKSCGAKTVDNTTATHVVAKDDSNEAENLTLPGGFAITGTTSPTLTMTDRFVASFDGGGSEIADNKKVHIYIPWDCTITGWTILADQSGSIDFGVWSDTVANHPATSDDSITDSHDPALSSADSGQDTDVADWSGEALTGGKVLTINVDSCTTITWASITFTVTR